MSGEFYAFRCKKCYRWGAKEIRSSIHKASYKCNYCGKSSKIKTKDYGLNLLHKGPFNRPQEASKVVIHENNKIRR